MEHVVIKIHGIVQGVGFRPFIHKLVLNHSLSGYIKNTSSGVELELEGDQKNIDSFVASIPEKAPQLALIEKIEIEYSSKLFGYKGFEIRTSKVENERNTLISPDVCICDDCLQELRDKSNRRFKYPFINCTNCGPRFTIIRDVPYDRAKTSMSSFPMCEECDEEYHNIENRRYHAQPDACFVCGPHCYTIPESKDPIESARRWIKEGKIVAIKGLGGMHLACRLDKASELRTRKHRDEKPFAVMCRDLQCAEQLCEISESEKRILTSYQRPIVLLKKKANLPEVSNNQYIGIMLPYTPLHYLIFGDDIDALIMTSANISETPIMYKNDEAISELDGIADAFLLHNREIQTRCDDSLCWVLDDVEYFARRSRGYVPYPIKLTKEFGPFLACGAEQKASFSLSKKDYVFLSQHIGDLKNAETYNHYKEQIDHFKNLFDIDPIAIACDLHPDYLSTVYAQEQGIPIVQVQHHHAHMVSCMADNNLDGEVIGLIWDGTGLGIDGTIWGAECLVGGYSKFDRFGSIKKIPLIGGDVATKELDRVAYILLNKKDNEVYNKLLDNNINCPKASSMGRLFDGVASICDIKHIATYEGQGAVLLEAVAENNPSNEYYDIEFEGNDFDFYPMMEKIGKEKNPAKFLNTLIEMATRQCMMARKETGISRVVLSGGTFQNMYIMKRLPKRLEKEGFEVFHHRRVSCNDEGISLGQLCVLQSHLK